MSNCVQCGMGLPPRRTKFCCEQCSVDFYSATMKYKDKKQDRLSEKLQEKGITYENIYYNG